MFAKNWTCDHCGVTEKGHYQTKMPNGWRVIRFSVREQTDETTDIREGNSVKVQGENRICPSCAKTAHTALVDEQKLMMTWKLKTYEEMYEPKTKGKIKESKNTILLGSSEILPVTRP